MAVQSELQACPPKKVALLGVLYGCGAVPVPVRLEGSEVAHPVVAENVAGHQKGHSVQPLDSKGEDSPRPVIFFLLLDPLMELRLVFPKVVVIVLRELHVPRVVPVGCHERAVVAVPLVVVQVLALRVLVLDCQAKPQIFQRLLSIRSHCVSDIVGALDTDPPSQCFDFAGYKEIGDQCMAVIASELTQLSVSFVPPFCGWIKCSDLPCTRRECHPPTQSRVHRVW